MCNHQWSWATLPMPVICVTMAHSESCLFSSDSCCIWAPSIIASHYCSASALLLNCSQWALINDIIVFCSQSALLKIMGDFFASLGISLYVRFPYWTWRNMCDFVQFRFFLDYLSEMTSSSVFFLSVGTCVNISHVFYFGCILNQLWQDALE